MKMTHKRLSESLKRRTAINCILDTISGIKRPGGDPYDLDDPWLIKAFLHKIVLSGDWGHSRGYLQRIKDVDGPLHQDREFKPETRMPNYQRKYIRQSRNFEIIVFSDPINYCAPFVIEVYPKEKASVRALMQLLCALNSSLGLIYVTSIEYAVDLYCHDRDSMQRLSCILKRFLRVPYQRKAKLFGEDCIQWGNETRMNAVYKAGGTKVYERGPDGKKKKKGGLPYWDLEACDRVRLERSFPRKLLKPTGISTLNDLIQHAKFKELNGEVYRFQCFEGSRKLPRIWEDYTTPDEKGNKNCLQYEINHGRQQVKNLNQYLKDVRAFDSLRVAVKEAMKRLDNEWISQ
jgi:hypothetical protein